MKLRLLAATTVAAAALAPLPAAQATCHTCFLGCDAACTPVYEALAAVESAAPASRATTLDHTVCHVVADTTHLNMHCDH